MTRVMLIQSSSETREWLRSLRKQLTDFEYREAGYYASFRSRSAPGAFAYLNPSKKSIRLFVTLDPTEDPRLQPTPSTHQWAARFPAVYKIADAHDLGVAARLIVDSYRNVRS